MTDCRVFAWILLSVPERGGKLEDLIAMADGVNHAIPTHQELQRSLGWLKEQGLVDKEGRNFFLTEDGARLLARARKPRQTMATMWDKVAAELSSLIGGEAPLDDLTGEELRRAYAAYNKDFWRRYRRLNKKSGT